MLLTREIGVSCCDDSQGWELAARALRLQPSTALVCRALVELAAGGEHRGGSSGAGGEAASAAEGAPAPIFSVGGGSGGGGGGGGGLSSMGMGELEHPGALQLLFEALAGCAQLPLQLRFLDETESLLELRARSFDAVLDSEWLVWVTSLLRAAETAQPPHEFAELEAHAVGLVSRTLLHDMTHTARPSCRLARLHELADAEVRPPLSTPPRALVLPVPMSPLLCVCVRALLTCDVGWLVASHRPSSSVSSRPFFTTLSYGPCCRCPRRSASFPTFAPSSSLPTSSLPQAMACSPFVRSD